MLPLAPGRRGIAPAAPTMQGSEQVEELDLLTAQSTPHTRSARPHGAGCYQATLSSVQGQPCSFPSPGSPFPRSACPPRPSEARGWVQQKPCREQLRTPGSQRRARAGAGRRGSRGCRCLRAGVSEGPAMGTSDSTRSQANLTDASLETPARSWGAVFPSYPLHCCLPRPCRTMHSPKPERWESKSWCSSGIGEGEAPGPPFPSAGIPSPWAPSRAKQLGSREQPRSLL